MHLLLTKARRERESVGGGGRQRLCGGGLCGAQQRCNRGRESERERVRERERETV